MNRPIFIVGLPRSGSTIFYSTLAQHPDLAYISQATKKFPRSLALTRLVMLVRQDRRPTEGHRIWRKFVRAEDDSFRRADATSRCRAYYRDLVAMHCRLYGTTRFLSKYPRNVLRLPWLDEMFPDALFLHLIRDGRAVVQSTLEMRDSHGGREAFWGIRPPGWRELLALEPLEAIALQWKTTIELARRSAAQFDSMRYLEVRYEDFCDRPADVLLRIGNWADLQWPGELLERVSSGIDSRNYKWRERLGAAEIDRLEQMIGDLLRDLGYPPAEKIRTARRA